MAEPIPKESTPNAATAAAENVKKPPTEETPPSNGVASNKIITTKMESATVLANAFVPESMRGTLNDVPGHCLPATTFVPDLLLSTQRIRRRTCPHLPLVPVTDSRHLPVAVPMRVMPYHDLHYALWHRMRTLGNNLPEIKLHSVEEHAKDLPTYRAAFEGLLMEERRELLLLYERYTQYNTKIYTFTAEAGSRRGKFTVKGITGARPSIQVGDSVVVRTVTAIPLPRFATNSRCPVELHLQCLAVTRHPNGDDVVQCSWISDEDSLELLKASNTNEFHIRIVPRADMLLRCLSAMSWLSTLSEDFFQKLMFPTEAPSLAPLDEHLDLPYTVGLNNEQLSFVRTIVQRTLQPDYEKARAPIVLTGPAGCGKTMTLLCAIRQVLVSPTTQRVRVLVCTPSHTAADVITRRVSSFFTNKQVFRLYNADRPVATVPVHILPFCRQQEGTGLFALPDLDELLSFDIIVCTCYDAHFLYQAGLTNNQLRLRRMEIEQAALVDLKLCGVNLGKIPQVHQPHFTHLFIDECAQATEPETLIPLSVVLDPIEESRKVEIALVGDPRQLSPQVFSNRAAKAGLARSWIERLLRRPVQCLGGGNESMLGPEMLTIDSLLRYSFARDGNEQISFFLTNNYRGHPSMLVMPSALFYADKLRWASYDRDNRNESLQNEWCERLRHVEFLSRPVVPAGEQETRKQFGFPIHFRGVLGKDKSHTATAGTVSEESWTNEKEAEIVAQITKTLTNTAGVSSEKIGIMAPFRGQVVLIRTLLRSEGLAGINVGTIEDFQGIEMEVVVLSLTRCTNAFVPHDVGRRIGVFGQKMQSNVALTRAEQLQIVVGNPDVMVADTHWRQWLWFCLRNGLWYGEEGNTRPMWEHLDRLPVVRTLRDDGQDSQNCVVVSRLEEILRNMS